MYDLVYFYPHGHEAHYQEGHPERPERIEAVCKAIQRAGWWDDYPKLAPSVLSRDLLEEIHTPAYLEALEAACARGASLDMDTYTTPASWDLALSAVGGGVAVARAVWQAESRRGFALTRPPGHHATSARAMGFCLLNNVALAAQDLLTRDNTGCPPAERLAIVDLDLHHGNGTQDIFYQRGDVFYLSTHQSPLYPGTGSLQETGAGQGAGATANFPLPPFTGDEGFNTVVDELILPLLDRFNPQMLLVSVGFDIHWRDPLGSFLLSAQAYHHLVRKLTAWADQNCHRKIVLFLEGGYDLQAGEACAQAFVSALLNKPWVDKLGLSNREESQSWRPVLRKARELWF